MKFVENAIVLSNTVIFKNCFKLQLKCPQICSLAKPGQFIEMACGENNFPLLNRPISIHNIFQDILEVIVMNVGKGTALLEKKAPGDTIRIVGPLGNGFTVQNSTNQIVVGGGYGAPPMFFLAKELLKTFKKENIFFVIGTKNKDFLMCEKEIMELGVNLCITTDDGSAGIKGFVTDSITKILDNRKESATIYACGPIVMMKNIYALSEKYPQIENVQCSMERIMGCGIGVCNGCVLEIKHGDGWTYKRVCKDGPVFNGGEIIW